MHMHVKNTMWEYLLRVSVSKINFYIVVDIKVDIIIMIEIA